MLFSIVQNTKRVCYTVIVYLTLCLKYHESVNCWGLYGSSSKVRADYTITPLVPEKHRFCADPCSALQENPAKYLYTMTDMLQSHTLIFQFIQPRAIYIFFICSHHTIPDTLLLPLRLLLAQCSHSHIWFQFLQYADRNVILHITACNCSKLSFDCGTHCLLLKLYWFHYDCVYYLFQD